MNEVILDIMTGSAFMLYIGLTIYCVRNIFPKLNKVERYLIMLWIISMVIVAGLGTHNEWTVFHMYGLTN